MLQSLSDKGGGTGLRFRQSSTKTSDAGSGHLRPSIDKIETSQTLHYPSSLLDYFHAQPCVMFVVEAPTSIVDHVHAAGLTLRNHAATDPSVARKAVRNSLQGVYDLEGAGAHRQAAREMMRTLEGNLKKNALDLANMVLVEVDYSKVSSRTLSGMIRSTFRVNNLLPAWNESYSKAWHTVEASGKSPNSTFVGLPKITR